MKQRKLLAHAPHTRHNFQTEDETSMKIESRPMDATEEHARLQVWKDLMESPTNTPRQTSCL